MSEESETEAPEAPEEVVTAYLECALWASSDLEHESDATFQHQNFGADDFTEAARKEAERVCGELWEQFGERIESANSELAHMAGHDLWLTRNRHGTGFWDGSWPEPLATELTDYAHQLGGRHVMRASEVADSDVELEFCDA